MAEPDVKKEGGKESFFKKHKTAVIAVFVILGGVLIYIIVHNYNQQSQASGLQNPGAQTPNAYSVPGAPGAQGPAGATGPRGPRGFRGKPPPRKHHHKGRRHTAAPAMMQSNHQAGMPAYPNHATMHPENPLARNYRMG